MNVYNFTNVAVGKIYYRINFWFKTKSEAVNRIKHTDLSVLIIYYSDLFIIVILYLLKMHKRPLPSVKTAVKKMGKSKRCKQYCQESKERLQGIAQNR